MTRFQIQLLVEVPDGTELERMKRAVANTLGKNPRIKVQAVSGHEVAAPGRPAEVKNEILKYLPGRKPKSAKQIAVGIKRTQRSTYKPLKELMDEGRVDRKWNNKYRMWQWFIPKETD